MTLKPSLGENITNFDINFTSVRERRGSIDMVLPFIIYNFQYVGHVNV